MLDPMLSDMSSISSHSSESDVESVSLVQRDAYTTEPEGVHLEAPLIRERFPYNAHENQPHPSHAGKNFAGSVPPPPHQGHVYNRGPTASYPPSTVTEYQRYTFIVVCCLAITSFLQISRGDLASYSGGQPNTMNKNASFKNNWIQGENNGVNAPYYYNNGNRMEGGRSNTNNDSNMMQSNGIQNGNGNEVAMSIQSQQSEIEAVASDPGIEKYPLTELSHFKDNWDEWEATDVPMFLDIPGAGGIGITDIMTECHRLHFATEMGITDGHADDQELAVVSPQINGQYVYPVVNVDTTTIEGIARAQQMGFADSGLADVVMTHLLHEANELFTPTAKGRIFTVFRHPVDRAVGMFRYIQIADWEPTYDPTLKDMTVIEYARSTLVENNWLTRQLSNKPEGDLSDDDLNLAMEVVRRKVIVGLMTEIEATMERFERFFRWTYHVNPSPQETCRENHINSLEKEHLQPLNPESEVWEVLSLQNNYDLQVYEYIESVFVEQEQFVAEIEVGFRNVDSTCCECDPPTFPPEGFTCL